MVAKCEGTLHFVPRSMVHCGWQLRAEALALGHTAAKGLKPWSGCAPSGYRIVQPPTFLSFVCEGTLPLCTPKGVRAEISYINTVTGVPHRPSSPAGESRTEVPSSPKSPWPVAQSPSFKTLLTYAENPPQESVTEKAMQDVMSSWIGGAVRKDQDRRYFAAVSRSDGFRTMQFTVGEDVMVLAPDGGLPYIARIEALFELLLPELPGHVPLLDDEGQLFDSKRAQLRWYYRPCDCQGTEAKSRLQNQSKSRSKEVFASAWTDENPVDSFLKNCYVVPRDVYTSMDAEVYDDVFFCVERYCPVKRKFSSCEDEIRRRDYKAAIRIISSRKLASYQKPKVGADYQCVVPAFECSSSPSCERGDKLVFERTRAFQGMEHRSETADNLLQTFRVNESSSIGMSEEMALMALYRTGGDVRRTDAQLKILKEQQTAGADPAGARQLEAMEREKKEHERDLIHERSHSLSVKLDLGDAASSTPEGRALSAASAVLVLAQAGSIGNSCVGAGAYQSHHKSAQEGQRPRKYKGLVQLDCDTPNPDGSCSNRGVYFDVVNKAACRVVVTGFSTATFDLPSEVVVWACLTGSCAGSVRLPALLFNANAHSLSHIHSFSLSLSHTHSHIRTILVSLPPLLSLSHPLSLLSRSISRVCCLTCTQ